MPAFQVETEVYQRRLQQMLKTHDGDYVVLRGQDEGRFFPDFGTALEWAFAQFGLGGAFVKRVSEDQGAVHFSRELG